MKMQETYKSMIYKSTIKWSAIILVLAGLILPVAKSSGQDPDAFKPGGKMEVRIFTGINTTFADGENHTKFDLGRAYLGYNYNFSKKLSGRIVYDVADPSVGKLKFTGMLKFAYLKFQSGKWTITGGMIALPEYDHSDKKWGYRYIYKPLHDEYGFGTAADLGLNVTYAAAKWISADLTVMNGEGFKLTEADSTFKVGGAITLMPVKGLSLRGYFDNMTKNSINQQTVQTIATYENKGFVVSAAYNFRRNHSLVDGQDYQGFTVNGTIPVTDRIKVLGRYDYVNSVIVGTATDPWNQAKDGQLILTGIDIMLAPGVNISPNFAGWKPAGPGMPFISRFSISLDLKI